MRTAEAFGCPWQQPGVERGSRLPSGKSLALQEWIPALQPFRAMWMLSQWYPSTFQSLSEMIGRTGWILFQGSWKATLEQPCSERSSPIGKSEEIPVAVGRDESVPATNDRPHRQAGNGSAAALLQLWTSFFGAGSEWAQNHVKQ